MRYNIIKINSLIKMVFVKKNFPLAKTVNIGGESAGKQGVNWGVICVAVPKGFSDGFFKVFKVDLLGCKDLVNVIKVFHPTVDNG